MDFTREPIIETVITPKEGYRLVVRSSKAMGQEEFFVDAVEVVSFGSALFFRSIEKPKAFLVPTSDYEVLEVREARMALKHVGVSRAIKIGGGREPSPPVGRGGRDAAKQGPTEVLPLAIVKEKEAFVPPADAPATVGQQQEEAHRTERKRERRRSVRRRTRSRESEQEQAQEKEEAEVVAEPELSMPEELLNREEKLVEQEIKLPTASLSPAVLSSLLPPPPHLIRETIARYRSNDMLKEVPVEKKSSSRSAEAGPREKKWSRPDKASKSEATPAQPAPASLLVEEAPFFPPEQQKTTSLLLPPPFPENPS